MLGDTVVGVWQIETMHQIPAESPMLDRLVGVIAADGETADPLLNDELLVAFRHRGGDGFVAVIAALDSPAAPPLGYAQASRSPKGFTVGLIVADDVQPADVKPLRHLLFGALLPAIAELGGGEVTWWAADAAPADDDLANEFQLSASRTLLEMRCPLPLGDEVVDAARHVTTRGFAPGRDDDAWLTVNNRAFAGHHEQGGWTTNTLHDRQAEPWFAAEDLLLHEIDGRLAGFCWMKLHPRAPVTEPLGEIYVIGVDPDFAGLGLGRSLAVAGYRHIARRGAATALLYVDDDNIRAIHLYESLGLRVSRRDVAFVTAVPARPAV